MEGYAFTNPQGGPSERTFTTPISRNSLEQPLSTTSTSEFSICGASSGAMDEISYPATIQILPNELLSNIFGFLDGPPPSALALYDEPTFELTHAEVADLKAVSLVSQRWRHAILPILFRHTRFIVPEPKIHRPALSQAIQPFLHFASKNSLHKVITSFTLLVHDKKVKDNPDGLYRLDGFAAFWEALFGTIDPAELLIVAPAEALGALTSCHIDMEDSWTFDCPCHYLRLQRPPLLRDSIEPEAASSFASGSSAVFQIRPWSSLLLNEGSFIKAYSTYEFWLRRPPSILPDLVGADDMEGNTYGAYISPTIRDMSYIGIFPMASHFATLTGHCPRLDRLYVQLVPRNGILDNREKMAQVEAEDLWMERNSCYAILIRELFSTPPQLNYRYLKIFESGDAADKDAWDMAVAYIKRSRNGWQAVEDGVFVKDPEDVVPEPAEGEADQSTLSVC